MPDCLASRRSRRLAPPAVCALVLVVWALALSPSRAAAQPGSALRQLSRGAASIATVTTRDASGNTIASGIGVFTDIGRLVVPRALLLDRTSSATIAYGGEDRRITAVLGDDPRSGLALVAVDLPDGAPPPIRARTRGAVAAGSYRAFADDGTSDTLELGAEQDLPGVGTVCPVTARGALPASGTPVMDASGEMVGVIVERVAAETRFAVLVPSARVLAVPPITPSSIGAWLRVARVARPADAEAAFLRGLDASLNGRSEAAAENFREAASRSEADPDARAALAVSELAAGRREAGYAAYREAIAADPANPRYRHDLAVALSDANAWDQAAIEFAEVARLRPADPEAHFNAGAAYGHLGRLEDEYREYQAALQQNPAHLNALRNLGIACIALKRYAEAVTVTSRALRFRPSDARLHAQLGVAYYDMKDYPAAIAELRQATTLEPDFVQAHYGLAVAYAVSGQREAALKACERLKALDPARGAEVARLVR